MKTLLFLLNKSYGYLLHLFPYSYRQEFAEEMLLDFSDMATDACRQGKYSLIRFLLKELIDFPVNLLQVHWKEDRLFKLLRSRPISTSIGVAFGFGLASFLSVLVNEIVFEKLFFAADSIIDYLQLYYFDLFHTTNGQPVVYWIPGAISSLCVGLILGVVFAVFVADRSEYPHFIFAVALIGIFAVL